MNTIKLLDAKTYKEMAQKALKDGKKLMQRAERTADDKTAAKLYARAQKVLAEAVELEMRRLAAERGATHMSF